MSEFKFEVVDLITLMQARPIGEIARIMEELREYLICEVCFGGFPAEYLDEPDDAGRFVAASFEVQFPAVPPDKLCDGIPAHTVSYPICNRCCGSGFPMKAIEHAIWRRHEGGWLIERDGCEVIQLNAGRTADGLRH